MLQVVFLALCVCVCAYCWGVLPSLLRNAHCDLFVCTVAVFVCLFFLLFQFTRENFPPQKRSPLATRHGFPFAPHVNTWD